MTKEELEQMGYRISYELHRGPRLDELHEVLALAQLGLEAKLHANTNLHLVKRDIQLCEIANLALKYRRIQSQLDGDRGVAHADWLRLKDLREELDAALAAVGLQVTANAG